MGIFFPSKKITPQKFQDSVRHRLEDRGLTNREVNRVTEAAEASLQETGSYYGMDRHEKDQLIETLRKHHSSNGLSHKDIETIDKTLSEEL